MKRVIEAVDRYRASRAEAWRRNAIAASPYFDARWYLANHDDLRKAGVDPLQHFLDHGEREGRDPGPDFATDAYIIMNPAAQGQALTHFHRTIAAAGREAAALRPNDIVDVTLPALTRNWFDADWYRTAHGPQTVHPWVHYRRTGLDPSPVFDELDYRSQMPDDELHQNALDHWLSGSSTIRPQVVSRDDGTLPPYRPLIQHRVRPRHELTDIDVAVMIHAFYLDVLPSLLEPLRFIPALATVLVSVVEPDDAARAHLAIDDVLGTGQPRTVKVVPNRGRNFAPLLCSFAGEVREHDVVLHLHTKKSLYSGGELTDWRTHLVEGLLPTPAAVDAILSLIADDTTVGVVQAPNWPAFPHWGNHWLGNRDIGRELYARLGVTDRAAHGYLMYPVGGMFWARVDALRPLLDLGLTAGDFDREHGQTDRTLAHAIERTIPAAAAVAGLDTVEFDYAAAQWRRNWSPTNQPGFGAADADGLDAALAPADLVSVDLFDTLVLRPSLDPNALFDVLALQSDAEAVAARRHAEHRLRVAGEIAGDVSLDEIYAAARAEHPDEDLRRLKQLELDLERRVAIPRTWLIEHLRADRAASGRRYVLMTDTTQPTAAIEALLDRIGAGDLFDELYVSNGCRARKDTGTMWDLVRTLEAPERWLHIGDNEFSDIQQASDRAISWFHVPAPAAIAQFNGVDSAILGDDVRPGTQLVAGHALAALASAQTAREPAHGSVGHFGYGVLGPLTLAFVNWTLTQSRERAIDRLLFTARDGYLAHAVLERLRPFLSDVPTADYFYVSRRAALGMLQHDGTHLTDILDAGDYVGRVDMLLDARIGFELRDAALGGRTVRLPDDTDRLLDQLRPFTGEIADHGLRELDAFHAYLRHLGIEPDEHLGLVDLGYSGTTQKALTELIDNPITGLYHVTTAAANELGDTALSCFGRDVTLGGHNLIYDKALTFELLCSAEHPQVVRFEHDRRGLRVVFDPRTASTPALRAQVEIAQRAALRFVHDHVEMFGPDVLALPLDPETVIDSLERCVGTLSPEVNDVFDGYVIDDIFCGRGEQSVTGRRGRRAV